jgi:hypothetical protein
VELPQRIPQPAATAPQAPAMRLSKEASLRVTQPPAPSGYESRLPQSEPQMIARPTPRPPEPAVERPRPQPSAAPLSAAPLAATQSATPPRSPRQGSVAAERSGVHVRIGRVEIRAVMPPAPPAPASPRPQSGFEDLRAVRTYIDRNGAGIL